MIAVGGENLIDLIQIGEAGGIPQFQALPGGSCYNCALAAARQNQRVTYLTPISKDNLGVRLADRLLADQISLAARSEAPSSLAVVTLKNSIPSYEFYREATAEREISFDGLVKILPPDTSLFHIGSLALSSGADAEIWADFFEYCVASGVLTSYDPNVRAALVKDRLGYLERVFRLMRTCSILKLSDEDLAYIFPSDEIDTAFQNILDQTSAALVVLTLGHKGCKVVGKGFEFSVEADKATPLIDTVGAGDTFMGALLGEVISRGFTTWEKLEGINEETARAMASHASFCAARNCESSGCNPPYKS